jgi:hypothetical protein
MNNGLLLLLSRMGKMVTKVALRWLYCLKSIQGWPVVGNLLNTTHLWHNVHKNNDIGLLEYVNQLLYKMNRRWIIKNRFKKLKKKKKMSLYNVPPRFPGCVHLSWYEQHVDDVH